MILTQLIHIQLYASCTYKVQGTLYCSISLFQRDTNSRWNRKIEHFHKSYKFSPFFYCLLKDGNKKNFKCRLFSRLHNNMADQNFFVSILKCSKRNTRRKLNIRNTNSSEQTHTHTHMHKDKVLLMCICMHLYYTRRPIHK